MRDSQKVMHFLLGGENIKHCKTNYMSEFECVGSEGQAASQSSHHLYYLYK